MAVLAHTLDLPMFEGRATTDLAELPADAWLARNPFGYAVWHYDDAIGILRDKRWHNAAGAIPQLMGVTDEKFLSRQSVNILSAEGDVHTRLRRLVAPAFSPRSADRLRPFMREVINGACPLDCPDTCGWQIAVEDGHAVEIRGRKEHPFTRGALCGARSTGVASTKRAISRAWSASLSRSSSPRVSACQRSASASHRAWCET